MNLNKKEFKNLFLKYYNPLCNFCYRYTSNHQDAEDIVQEVFINIWKRREELDLEDNWKLYLFKAVKNKSLEMLKTKSRKELHIRQFAEQQEEISILEDNADKYLLIEYLFTSIRQLPPKCQRIFIMSKVGGLTYSEIASELNISQKTVESQMSRAFQLLRKKLRVD